MFVKEPDFRRTADHVVGHDAFDHNGLDPEDAAQVDADVSESLFFPGAPSGGGIHPRFPRLVIASLGSSVEHAVRNLAGSDADGQDDAAFRSRTHWIGAEVTGMYPGRVHWKEIS